MEGEVLWAGVVDVDQDSATVIAATSGTVANQQTDNQPVARNFRLRLDLVLEDGQWLDQRPPVRGLSRWPPDPAPRSRPPVVGSRNPTGRPRKVAGRRDAPPATPETEEPPATVESDEPAAPEADVPLEERRRPSPSARPPTRRPPSCPRRTGSGRPTAPAPPANDPRPASCSSCCCACSARRGGTSGSATTRRVRRPARRDRRGGAPVRGRGRQPGRRRDLSDVYKNYDEQVDAGGEQDDRRVRRAVPPDRGRRARGVRGAKKEVQEVRWRPASSRPPRTQVEALLFLNQYVSTRRQGARRTRPTGRWSPWWTPTGLAGLRHRDQVATRTRCSVRN